MKLDWKKSSEKAVGHQACKNICSDNSGAAMVMWGLLLPVIIGGIGLGTDIGSWYLSEHGLQNATDAAAIAAAYEITGGNPQQSTMQTAAQREMSRNGFGPGSNLALTVHYSPQSGAYAGDSQSVEVISTRPQSRFFSRLFVSTDPIIQSRAVASRQPHGSACVLALDGAVSAALLFQGNADINLNNCSAASNSTDTAAIKLSGSSTLNAYSLYTPGNYELSGSAELNTNQSPVTGGAPLSDPYGNLPIPSYGGCSHSNYKVNTSATINPGVYCNGLDFGAKAVVTMNPGTYIIDRGSFEANAKARVTGNGVTIILTSSTGTGYATIKINGGATVSLTAPTADTYAGVVMYQDRNAPIATNTNKLNGGSTTSFTGALYFPRQELQFTGNNSLGGGSCTKIIARTITFTGSSYFTNECPASVATVATSGTVQLVE